MLQPELEQDNGTAFADTGLDPRLLAEMESDMADGIRNESAGLTDEEVAEICARVQARRDAMTPEELAALDADIDLFYAGGPFERPTQAA